LMLSCAGDNVCWTWATQKLAESKDKKSNFDNGMCLAPLQKSVAA